MPTLANEKLRNFEAHVWPLTLPEQNDLQDAIHAPHLAERDRYILALFDSSKPALQNSARRMATCADSVHLYVDSETLTVHEYLHRCNNRLCPLCARSRAIHVGAQVEDLVRAMKVPRHLVLTVKSGDRPLIEQLHNLRSWFAKFRRTSFWKKNVYTGVYTIECTINERTGLWHPHIHCVFDGYYLPYKVVQHHWHEITGGSEIIWLEAVDNIQGMARELCKYIGKPQDAAHWTDMQLRAYAEAIHGQRLMQTFGKSQPKSIEDKLEPQLPRAPLWSISLSRILWLASMNVAVAYKALPLIAERWAHLGRFIYQRMPQLEPEGTKAERILAVMAIIETGRAPPRQTRGAARAPELIEAELTPLLEDLHGVNEDDLWHQ